jgi:hypothetical protein
MKILCALFGHKWEWTNPESVRGRAGVRSYCARCRLESAKEQPARCSFCHSRAVVFNPLYGSQQCTKCAEVFDWR